MAASYPGAIKSFLQLQDGVDEILAAHHNEAYDEIEAVETELGTDPKGSFADVKTRLAALQPATLAGATKLVLDADGDTHLDVTADDTLRLTIANVAQAQLTNGLVAFQKAMEISTTAGNLTLDAADSLIFETGNTSRLTIAADVPTWIISGMMVGVGVPPAPDSLLHLWKASAGTVAAEADSLLVLEHNDNARLTILTPVNKFGAISFGDPDNASAGSIVYTHGTGFDLWIEAVKRLAYSAGAFAFQEETVISTAADNLTVQAAAVLVLTGGSGILVSTSMRLADNLPFIFGSDSDYNFVYASGATRLALVSSDVDGIGTDGDIFRVADGTNDVCFLGGLATDGQAAPTAGIAVGGLVDLSAIGAGNPLLKIVATSDTPTATWGAAVGNEVSTAPTGWMEILIGETPYYIPYWA